MMTNNFFMIDRDVLEGYIGFLRKVKHFPSAREIEGESKLLAKRMQSANGMVAVVPVHGVIEQRTSIWSYYFGGFSTEKGEKLISSLLESKEVCAIVLDIDSPGGTVSGVEEFADFLRAAQLKKPIYAIANSLAASAAYWIATSVDSLTVTKSGFVGSVGVYIQHVDYSKMFEEAGIKVTFIQAGDYKTDGNPYQPLSDSAKSDLQKIVDTTYSKFVKAVAKGRNLSPETVRRDFGQGRLIMAEEAKQLGMVDRISTLSEMLGKLQGRNDCGNTKLLKLRQEQRKRLSYSYGSAR